MCRTLTKTHKTKKRHKPQSRPQKMSTYDVSADLINKVQILLVREAGLPSFKPSDQSPPSILQHAISTVGSNSDDVLQCDSCTGELLRGFDSIICIFCGCFPSKLRNLPSPRQPVNFTSTLGFRWFLRSLSLDGSEIVERPVEGGNELGRGRSSVKNEIPLSALLDLQLKWPDESSRFGVEDEPGKQSVKLVGLDFDELFQRDVIKESTLNEQEVTSTETKVEKGTTFAGQSSLSLFENTQTAFSEGENDESDWAAEFQSANADVKVDTRFQMDSTCQSIIQEDSANIEILQAFSTSIVEPKSEPPMDPKQTQRNMSMKDDEKGLETIDNSFDWIPPAEKQRISDEGDPLHDDKLGGGNTSYNWDEFGMFSGAENKPREHVSSTGPGRESGGGFNMYGSWNDFTGSVGAEHKQLQNGILEEFALSGHPDMEQQDVHVESTLNKTTDQAASLGVSGTANEVNDSFDLWTDFKTSNIGDDNQQQFTDEASGDKVSPAGFGITNAQNHAAGLSSRVKEQSVGSSEAVDDSSAQWNDDSLDVWSEFALSTGVLGNKPSTNETSAGALNDFSSIMVTCSNFPGSGETKSAENETSMQDDDDFGSWSDFRSSWKQPDSSFPEIYISGSMQDDISAERAAGNLPSVADNNLHNSWGDVSWSTSILEQPSHVVEAKPSESKVTSGNSDLLLGFYSSEKQSDFPDNQIKSDRTAVQNGKSTTGNDEEIDAWTDFTSSSNEQSNNWLSSNINPAVIQGPVIHDPFNEWNVISDAPNKESGRFTVANENQMNIFSTNAADSHFVGSNSAVHQDPFLGMLNDQNGFAPVPSSQTEVPNLVRTEHQDVEASDFDNGSESTFKERNDQKSVVESIISEMHDLSFMLESTLSIPKTHT
ncbi:hypothetical protein RND81_11G076400 [Saponaria officinalis]|uniref:DUF7815 domain-containing protein n=1 Tax=Saponaria officinalis TaxID=3572 RepID=A0AAW1HI58_SAPOF